MISETRTYLKCGDKIMLVHDGEDGNPQEWTVIDVVGEGASSVCYSVIHGNKKGRLKQFNPLWGEINEASMENFLKAYRDLDEAKYRDAKFSVLNNYIPHYEILFSLDGDNKKKGTYIWTPNDKTGLNFSNYIDDISQSYGVNTNRKLYDVISIIYTISDCICLMHMCGLLHLDIKPANFLVTIDSKMEVNAGNISMFDINTISSVENEGEFVYGTEGFAAPEVNYGQADNRSDIYSIGAMLYNATVHSKPGKTEYYDDSNYDELPHIIKESNFIKSLSINDNERKMIEDGISNILTNSLAVIPDKRYDCCEQLMEDLDSLKVILWRIISKECDDTYPPIPVKKNNKLQIAVAGAFALLLIIIGVLLYKEFMPRRESNASHDDLSVEVAEEQKEVAVTDIVAEKTDVSVEKSEWADWSEWDDNVPDFVTEDKFETEEKEQYSFRRKHTLESSNPSEEGWILKETKTTDAGFSSWSDWSLEEPEKKAGREIESKTQYSCSDYEETTSGDSSLGGWQQDSSKTETVYGGWSSFSDWSTSGKSASDCCEVESKKQFRVYEPGSNTWSDWYDGTFTTTGGGEYKHEERTVYRYRERSIDYIYHFYRWTEASDYSDSPVSESANRRVTTRNMFRYRDSKSENTYCYYKWDEWSEYSDEPIEGSDNIEVQTKKLFRYREKQ